MKIQSDVMATVLSILGTADNCGVDLLEADASAIKAIHNHLLERMDPDSREYTKTVSLLKNILETGEAEIGFAKKLLLFSKKLLTLALL